MEILLDFKFNKNDKNFKFMVLSVIVLIVLFLYASIKSSVASGGYFFGLMMLLALLGLAFFVSKNKDKVQDFLESKLNIKISEIKANYQTNQKTETVSAREESGSTNFETMLYKSNVTFADVHGIDSIKSELIEVADFLNNPKKYKKFGVKLPKGVLLVGAPGVGKTMIAKALAGETKVPFFYQSGASFVQIYVGMGAKRVRELFAKAKASAPAIIFIDEIDAVGKKRGDGRNDEREGTLNELLTQMDGFEENAGILVLAATNNIDVLDEALLRSGRFDRRVYVPMPNASDREDILRGYLAGKNTTFDLEKIAKDLAGFSGASIATLVNEASLNQLRKNSQFLELSDIEIAKNKIRFGTKINKFFSNEQKDLLAIYQSARAFFGWKLIPNFDKISLFDESINGYDKQYLSKTEMINLVKLNLCGHIAVEIIKFEPYSIFPKDLENAKKLIKDLATEFLIEEDEHKVLNQIKAELRSQIMDNKSSILRLKEIMVEKEELQSKDLMAGIGSLI